jgi:hypothetical protein
MAEPLPHQYGLMFSCSVPHAPELSPVKYARQQLTASLALIVADPGDEPPTATAVMTLATPVGCAATTAAGTGTARGWTAKPTAIGLGAAMPPVAVVRYAAATAATTARCFVIFFLLSNWEGAAATSGLEPRYRCQS